jgi:hypothetical protein
MLNQVPIAMRIAARAMVMRHPNSIDCQVWRRQVTRTAGAASGSAGGLPTLGGLTVMDSDDEPQVDYSLLGDAKVHFTGLYERTTLADAKDSAVAQTVSESLIEPVVEGAFEPKDGDLVMVMPGAGVVITYEVTNVLNTVNIPPFLPKYELGMQGDMVFVPGVSDSLDDR